MSAPRVRTFEAHEWRIYRDLRLGALADSPDAFGSTLAAEDGRPDDEWKQRLASGVPSPTDLPLVALWKDRPCGLAWGRGDDTDSTVAWVYQMWVAPEARGHGAGAMLLDDIIGWATIAKYEVLVLGAAIGDTPAQRLYQSAGFEATGPPWPIREGSTVLGLKMELQLREPAA